jgi:diguanylate cyclase (GGDEF)-like protein/PAS domain S-box-containing protein
MQSRSNNKALLPHRLRGLVLGTALTIGAIVGTSAIVLEQLHQDTLLEVQVNLLRQSLTLSELTERTYQSVDLVLGSVVEKIRATELAGSQNRQLASQDYYLFLKEKMAGLPQIDTLGILDAEGKRLNHTREWPSQVTDLSYREYYQALIKNPKLTSFIGEPVQGISSGAWTVIVARPILMTDGRLIGVVFASTTLKYIEDIFRATSLGDGYAATLMRQDGTLLARYPVAGKIGTVAPASVLKRMANARSGVSRSISPVDHQARIAAAYRLENYPLLVVATQTEEAAFSAWRKMVVIVGSIGAGLSFVIAIAAFLVARSWKQQERLNAARAEIIESDKIRALAEAELTRQKDLALQNMRFNSAVQNMPHGICMFGADKRLIVANDLYSTMYGLDPKQAKAGSTLLEILNARVAVGSSPKDSEKYIADRLEEAFLPEPGHIIDKLQDGRVIAIARRSMPDGGSVAIHQDVTAHTRAEQELHQTKQFLDSIIENIPISVVVKDAATRKFILTNRAFDAMLGLQRAEVIGKTAFDLYRTKDAELMNQADNESIEGMEGINSNDYEVETPKLGARTFSTKRIVTRDAKGNAKYLVVVIEDITEKAKSEQRIAFMAHHDALTGLANRVAVAQKIEDAAARHRRWGDSFTVLLLDLDRFKDVNDTLGHSAGDALLREAAMRLKALLRETDVLARLGGDEFAIVQPNEPNQREAASMLAERIFEILAEPFDIEGNEVNIGTSIGIALAPEHGTKPDNLLKMADVALYRAKSAGRNGYRFFDSDMGAAANARHELERELRRAIQQDQLELHYQPIVDSVTRKICGAEALVRWRHPTKGMIFPDQFIPLAEETGLIVQIGEWVLQTACADAVSWPPGVKLAVNLSPVQLRKINLSDIVMYTLAQSGLPPERLELEVTETALIESAVECLPVLRQFKNLGIAIALDDFGTGYSSLRQLTMFPFDKIKIDKSFTQNLTKRTECAAIIAATLTLAQSLNIETTAEGVETVEQYKLLRLAGVKSLQGYLFKRPCPVSEIDFMGAYGSAKITDAA